MKVKYILGATALSLILAGAAYPQQEQEKEKPQQQEQKPEQKPAEQPKQKPAEQPKTQQRQEQQSANKQQQQEQKNEQKQEKQSARQQSEQQKQSEQGNRERQDVTKQRTDERDQHSDHDHGRIPDDRFRASFGREHHFRVGHFDNRRFQYGGYWFSFNEGWPVGWAYTDDFYIDFIDGQYYLIDLTRPGVQLLLVVD
jgi:hypothetical protein